MTGALPIKFTYNYIQLFTFKKYFITNYYGNDIELEIQIFC